MIPVCRRCSASIGRTTKQLLGTCEPQKCLSSLLLLKYVPIFSFYRRNSQTDTKQTNINVFTLKQSSTSEWSFYLKSGAFVSTLAERCPCVYDAWRLGPPKSAVMERGWCRLSSPWSEKMYIWTHQNKEDLLAEMNATKMLLSFAVTHHVQFDKSYRLMIWHQFLLKHTFHYTNGVFFIGLHGILTQCSKAFWSAQVSKSETTAGQMLFLKIRLFFPRCQSMQVKQRPSLLPLSFQWL